LEDKPWFEEDPEKQIHIRKRIQYREYSYRHHSSRLEQQLLGDVLNGDVEGLREHINTPLDGELGITSRAGPVRNIKNIFICMLTVVGDRVIQAGLDREQTFTLSDAYIQAAETLESVEDVIDLMERMFLDFTIKMKGQREERYSKPIVRVLSFIEQNLSEELSVSILASHAFVSPNYLCKLFKKETGQTIALYIQAKRIDEAAKMLQFTDYSILDISLFLQFRNQSYFTRIFRERMQITPGKYRRLRMSSVRG
jgi:AraC-like DNA-binding protein